MRVDERALLDRACHRLAPFRSRHDPALVALVVPRLVALGRLPPGRLRVVALRAPLAAAVRMVDRVHRHAAHLGAPAEPADAAGLAVGDVLVLEVADLPDGGAAGQPHAPQLARGELHEGVVALLRHELDGGARAAAELAAAALAQLDVVDHGAGPRQRQPPAAPGPDVGPPSGL